MGAGEERAVVVDGKVEIATVMTVTMSGDHRVIDGATGAKFLQTFKQLYRGTRLDAAMSDNSFDVIVVGGGPGGYVCAIRAAQLGLKTAVVERDRLGGICLNWGCIPTKALLRSSEIWHLMHRLNEFGFSADNFKFDIKKIVERSRKVSEQLSNGVGFLMKKHKITVIAGEAKLAGKAKLSVTKDGKTSEYTAKNIVLATGARARTLPGLEPDGKLIWTYREAMVPPSFPKSLLVVGSGAIGIEFASFYRTLGADVTVVEVLDRVLPVEDEEISAFAAKAFAKQGMKLKVGTTVTELQEGPRQRHRHLESQGRQDRNRHGGPRDPGDGHCRQCREYRPGSRRHQGGSHPCGRRQIWRDRRRGVWAIGDLVGAPWLAHKAMHEGVIVAEKIAGVKGVHPLNTSNVPGCTYCWPQVASVGLTEAKAKETGKQDQGRPLPLYRQRQGHRPGRGRRPDQDRVRCRDR